MPTSNEPTSTRNVKYRTQMVKEVRAEAVQTRKRLDKRMVDKHKRRYKTVEYKRDDNVSVRIGYGGKKFTSKRRFLVEGKILKKVKHSDN